jgi:hypothetical protein
MWTCTICSAVMCREDPALKVSHMQQSSLWQPDICIYQDQLLCAATMPDKIGGAGGVQTQACGAAAAALASMGSCQTQSAAAWNNGAQGTSGLHHAACLEALAMAGQQQGTAHQSTAPRYQCGTQRSTSACTYARFQGCSNVQHHCSQPEAITIGGQLDDTIAYTGMLCLTPLHTLVCCVFCMMTPLLTLICCFFCMMTPLHALVCCVSCKPPMAACVAVMHAVSLQSCLDHCVVGYPGQSL